MLKEPFSPCPVCKGTIILEDDGGSPIQRCESCGVEYDIFCKELDTKEILNDLFH